MTTAYLHGAEILQQTSGPLSIQTVDSAVIGLVCTSPIHRLTTANQKVNQLVLVQNETDAADFIGPEVAGFTGPNAWQAILDQGGAKVVVVNVFDPAVHKSTVTSEVRVLAGSPNVTTLAHGEVLTATVKNSTDTTTYVENTDYTLNKITGMITRLAAAAFALNATLHVTYSYADPTLVLAADVVGTVATGDIKSGWQLMMNAPEHFGLVPRNLISPVYSTQNTVSAEMIIKAGKLGGHAFIDAPIATTRDQAIAGRGPDGTINFFTSDKRAVLCYPHYKVVDGNGATVLRGASQYVAGVWSATDAAEGFWVSPSNHEVKGVIGREFLLSSRQNDPLSDINALNAVGIVTTSAFFGAGLRVWGNRSAAFPTSTDPSNFLAIQRALDIIHESILRASLQFQDKAITYVQMDIIQHTVDAFLSTIQQQGGLVGAKVFWRKADNPITELAAGHATWAVRMMPPPPLERMTFLSFLDINLLENLFRPVGAA